MCHFFVEQLIKYVLTIFKIVLYKLLPSLKSTSCFNDVITDIVEYVFPAQDQTP